MQLSYQENYLGYSINYVLKANHSWIKMLKK